ncbi:hypothetical protein RHMOL_Rhmol06G0091200 [Rhododendron molle]|uniref:Uncharacterized protein n=1 Tax=Rhododendron molle TaxID=49168 RepID=A0ACC0NBL0_RHOML|nr:hypothetical protein RHMOL_Rhmol06G0091200 [Rhododendron molle]
MARKNITQIKRRRNEKAVMALSAFVTSTLAVFCLYFFITSTKQRPCPHLSPNPNFYQTQVDNLNRLVRGNESDCYDLLRVNRHTFMRLCFLVRGVGLGDPCYVCLEERVAIFLWIISHHTKQRRTKYEFWRSGEKVSRHFNAVLQAILRLYNMLLEKPEPIPPNYHDSRWSWFSVMTIEKLELAEIEGPSKKPRKTWRQMEEDTLLKVMINEVSKKWKWPAENGFRPGFYTQCPPKKDQGMNMKPFPMFDDWVVLFGKDRATGEGAEDPAQMAMLDVFGGPDDVYMPHFGSEFDGSFFNETPSTPTLTPTRPNSTPPASTPHRLLPTATPRPTSATANPASKKRKRIGEEEESLHANMNAFLKDTSSHMGEMVNSVGYERDLSKCQQNVQIELGKLNITLIQKFMLSVVICEEEQRVDNFYKCKEEEMQEHVEAILNGEIYGPI